MSWHTYFMAIAILSSFRSKDRKTQNGACIVGRHNRIIGIGYNGLPRGLNDNDPFYWGDDDDQDRLRSKHTYVVHAEKNAIYNCMPHDMTATTMYVTEYPCNTCAQAIIQVGICKVIYLNKKSHHESLNAAVTRMFREAKVGERAYLDLGVNDTEFIERFEGMRTMYE
jgi:dCMP deaminase